MYPWMIPSLLTLVWCFIHCRFCIAAGFVAWILYSLCYLLEQQDMNLSSTRGSRDSLSLTSFVWWMIRAAVVTALIGNIRQASANHTLALRLLNISAIFSFNSSTFTLDTLTVCSSTHISTTICLE